VSEIQQTMGLNATEFGNDDSNASNRSVEQRADPWSDFSSTKSLFYIICYVAVALGIPGNILSAVVWLRRHLASESQSAIYLAALAISDLVAMTFAAVTLPLNNEEGSLGHYLFYPIWAAVVLGSLLVLTFSVVRLIAIRRPLQVCCITSVCCAPWRSG